MQIEDAYEEYRFHLRAQGGRHLNWIIHRTAMRAWRRYAAAASGPTLIEDVRPRHCREFIIWLGEQGLRPHTVNCYVRQLRSAFRWFCRAEEDGGGGFIETSPWRSVPPPRVPQVPIQPLTVDEIDAVLRAAKATRYPRRNTAVLALFLDTGLRLSELAGLEVQDISSDYSSVLVRKAKAHKTRMVPLSPSAAYALKRYVDRRKPLVPTEHQLFLSEGGARITSEGIYLMVRAVLESCGLGRGRRGAHLLRHSFATGYLNNGGNVFDLKAILGHSRIEMTERYHHATLGDLKVKHQRLSPIAGKHLR